MKKKRNRQQVTCLCCAYNFPHRIGGGKCSGSYWAESYYEIIGTCCDTCNCNNEHYKTCDVASGIEDILQCEGYQDHFHYAPCIRLPIAVELVSSLYLNYPLNLT